MENMNPNSTRRSLLRVCIDANSQHDFRGRLESPLFGSRPFCGAFEMMREMNAIFDRLHFPQRAFQTRSFFKIPSRRKDSKMPEEERAAMGEEKKEFEAPEDYRETPGQQATFMVHVMFRQNATWQGRVQWLENGKNASFDSVLELMTLMETALASKGKPTVQAKWDGEREKS